MPFESTSQRLPALVKDARLIPVEGALQLHALTGADAREDSAAGTLVLEGQTGEAATGDGARIWAGRIADPFYIDLSLLAIVNGAVAKGTAVGLSATDAGVWRQINRAGHPMMWPIFWPATFGFAAFNGRTQAA